MKRAFVLPDSEIMFYFYITLEQILVCTKETNILMESKLNQKVITEYTKSFSRQLLPGAYQDRKYLGGQDILSLTPLKQVNLLVVQGIFLRWKSELEQIKSPYFDYQAKEVEAALQNFMNTVSRHIAIDQEHLQPLLEKAVQDTLYLLLAPYDFYFRMLSNTETASWTVDELEERLKYLRINRSLLETLTAKCRETSEDTLSREQVVNIYKEVAGQHNETPEDTDVYMQQFNQVAHLDVNSLTAANQHTSTDEGSFFDSLDAQPTPPIEVEAKPQENTDSGETPRTLNDSLNQPGRSTLADQHQQRKIEKLSQHISVNQKFMFIRELFENDGQAFASAIERLDAQSTYAEAVTLIRREYAQDYRWKMDSEEVAEFMDLLAKRF